MKTNQKTGNKTQSKENIRFTKANDQKALLPYCEQAKIAAENKRKAEELRPAASEYLRKKLRSDPETREFTGTVVCIFDDKIYQIRVQRPGSVDWMSKKLKDPNHREYKALKKKLAPMEARAKELEDQLAKDHPRCITRGFVIAFMNK